MAKNDYRPVTERSSKLEVKKAFPELYSPPAKRFTVVDVPPMNFLMLDGHGNPNTAPIYKEVVETLYALAYTIKFTLKKQGVDLGVAPLEGLWWIPDMARFSLASKDEWDWTMMIMQPGAPHQLGQGQPGVTAEVVEQARAEVLRKKGLRLAEQVRFEVYEEGLAAQILYTGAYADEGPTIAALHAFIQEQGYQLYGKHHEIYLGDPRRSAPEKLKTVIRQPMRKNK